MIVELGHFCLALALAVAIVQAVLPLWGAQRARLALVQVARPAARVQFALLLAAYAALTWAFIDHDFSVALAASHSNSGLPLIYRITAVWGNHEGSVLLWALILSGWTCAVSVFSRSLDEATAARVIGIMGAISSGFLSFTLAVSNPFTRLLPAAEDGRDLNPLLQDPGMIIHPPILYMGYVGLVVAFAFAVSALMAGRLDAAWARWSRPWTLAAWCFLTLGIALGSFWAYYELGWGGWWFWDPVENASFMPWLVATALVHSLAVTEKRGALRVWTALLAILAFSLSLLGTFIVRSGVLSSVHAFASDPARGVLILGFLAVVIGGSLALFAWRAPKVGLGGEFAPVSRESMLLAGNLLLAVAAAAVLLGTLYPLVLDALGGGKISVGPPYFQAVFVPLVAPALFLMGLGPLARWREAAVPDLAGKLRWAAAASVAGALVLPWMLGHWSIMTSLGLALSLWIAGSGWVQGVQRLRAAGLLGAASRPAANGARESARSWGAASWWGMLLAHLGVAVFVAGVTIVGSLQTERDVRMSLGSSAEVGGYRFELESMHRAEGPNYLAIVATVRVTREGQLVARLQPERRTYTASRMPMTEVAIDRGFLRDLYVALGEPVGEDAFSMRVHHKPLVNWIWGGCQLMALGGLLAGADRRYRTPARRHASQAGKPLEGGPPLGVTGQPAPVTAGALRAAPASSQVAR